MVTNARLRPVASAAGPAAADGDGRRRPLVGRTREVAAIDELIDAAAAGRGGALFLAGEAGVGKSRLAEEAIARARARKFTVAAGRAYDVERGTPYAPIADAVVPLLRALEPGSLATLSRGGEAELSALFPTLGSRAAPARGDSPEIRTRQHWTLAQLLGRLAARAPLFLVVEDIHWADASSVELLHFIARQVGEARIAILASYTTGDRDRQPSLLAAERSLIALGVARTLDVEPLARHDVDALLHERFGVEPAIVRDFSGLLYAWTRGNAFFIEETLAALVASGRVSRTGGAWVGWDVESLELPRSVRDAVRLRLDRLSSEARRIADLCAVIGAPIEHDALAAAAGAATSALLDAIGELRRAGVVIERPDRGLLRYELAHPILMQTLLEELGGARVRALHGELAIALERHHGEHALDHADELARHFLRADSTGDGRRAIRYLASAGVSALARHANREAAEYLEAALARADASASRLAEDTTTLDIVEHLARARQRLGEYDAARTLFERVRDAAGRIGDARRRASAERRLGLTAFWSGRYEEALERYAAAHASALAASDHGLAARIQINTGMCLQTVGRGAEALAEVHHALQLAEFDRDEALLARVHRSLQLLHLWMGPAEQALDHGREAIRLAEASGHRSLAFQAHWGMAVLGGLTGDARLTRTHLDHAEALADELHSPVLRVMTGEIAIEYLSFTGAWDDGLALAERTIALARTVGRPLLPRILVWTSLMYLGRGELERAKRYVDEAWSLAMASRSPRGLDLHLVVPAHTGLAAYHLATGDYEQALEVGRAGVAIADQAGYVVWALHRLLPIVAEASLWSSDVNGAAWIGRRLRRDAERLGQKLGLAWADACDALVAMVRGNRESAVRLLRESAEQLEAIPFVADGARMRRQLGRALADSGDRDGATRELRRAHDVFARLGAKHELDATREQMRELGARPPVRVPGTGAEGLTGRELEIIRLVAERKSNRAIGDALDISPRTVSTHLSNIFGKLGVESRGELTDLYRERLRHVRPGAPADETLDAFPRST